MQLGALYHTRAFISPIAARTTTVKATAVVITFRRRSAILRVIVKLVCVIVALAIYAGFAINPWLPAIGVVFALDIETFLNWRATVAIGRLFEKEDEVYS